MFFKCVNHAAATDHGGGQVVTNGKKHFAVDIHCHVHVPEADALLPTPSEADQAEAVPATIELTAGINRLQQQTILPKLTDPAIRLADMDACGIDVQALSPSPAHYNYHHPAEIARDASKVVNDRIAEIVAGNPDRFVPLCTVPLQNVDMAVAELDRCVKEHDARGVEISTNVNGQDLTAWYLGPDTYRCQTPGISAISKTRTGLTKFSDHSSNSIEARAVVHRGVRFEFAGPVQYVVKVRV